MNMTDIITLKIISILLIFITAFAAGVYPFFKKIRLGTHHDFPSGQALASGIFLSAGLIHMLGDAAKDFYQLHVSYPFPFLLAGGTFLFLLLLEHLGREIGEHQGSNSPSFAVLAFLMLSIHSILEGAALGFGSSISMVLVLFLAIVAHKWAASFALAVQITKTSLRPHIGLLLFIIFTLSTPLGILLGTVISDSVSDNPFVAPIFNSLAAGTFLYLGTLHGLNRAFMIEKCCNLRHFSLVIVGFAIMAFVAIWT